VLEVKRNGRVEELSVEPFCAGVIRNVVMAATRSSSPDRHGRGIDYSIALVERVSTFFIVLIGFEWVRPRLTPGT
jgi:hypothetical protein